MDRKISKVTENEKKNSSKHERLIKRMEDLIDKVRESKVTSAKAKEEAASIKTSFDTSVKQLVEA